MQNCTLYTAIPWGITKTEIKLCTVKKGYNIFDASKDTTGVMPPFLLPELNFYVNFFVWNFNGTYLSIQTL